MPRAATSILLAAPVFDGVAPAPVAEGVLPDEPVVSAAADEAWLTEPGAEVRVALPLSVGEPVALELAV